MNVEIPLSLAVSPDGRYLWAITNFGRVFVFDIQQSRVVGGPFDVGSPSSDEPQYDLTLTPDGRWALVTNRETNAVSVIDAARLRLGAPFDLSNPTNMALEPVAIEVSPEGRRAFVANQGNQSISVIDLATRQVSDPIVVGEVDAEMMDTAVTPAGDRLYVGIDNLYPPDGLFFLPLGRQFPDHWTLTQGFATPLPFGDPHHLTAKLGPITQVEQDAQPARPSALSQVVAATGGSSYDFSFWGIAEADGATAEVMWRGGACSLQRVDRVPIQIVEPTRIGTTARTVSELRLHRARLQAPPGTTQAEIRFLVPTQKNATIDTVSFQATAEAVANGDFLFANEDGEVAGWEVMPGTAVGFTILPDETGSQLSNGGSQPVALVQRFPVTAGQPFVLLCQGETVSQLAGREPARLELHWLDAQDVPTGSVTSLPIQPGETEHRLQESVPTAVANAELHLVIPPATTLSVRQLSFVPVELVMVPVQFLAQAPGDLTVTGFRVAYDVRTASAAPVPADGLCPPTPPGRRPDGKSGCVCSWCDTPCCDACADEPAGAHDHAKAAAGPVRALAQVRRTTRPLSMTRGPVLARTATMTRTVAVAEQVELVATPPPPIQSVEANLAMLMQTPRELAGRAPELALASVPLTAIRGVGERRALSLARLEVDSIARLATAVPETIAAELPGVSLTIARNFVAEAQALLTDPAALPAPLVSCLMPTYNRRHFVPKAIELFQRQDYPNRELIILDDGEDSIADLVPDDESIRYVRLATRQSIGEKHNLGCEQARGPLIAHWDDDVWVAEWRLSYQVAALIEYEADLCGLDNLLHYDILTGQAWHSTRPSGTEPWMPGSTFCYRKLFWQMRPFTDRRVSSDIVFLRQRPEARIIPLQAITWLVDIIHGQNSSPKDSRSPLWHPYPVAEIQRLMGDDFAFYQNPGF